MLQLDGVLDRIQRDEPLLPLQSSIMWKRRS
jgi:hypothetical protein